MKRWIILRVCVAAAVAVALGRLSLPVMAQETARPASSAEGTPPAVKKDCEVPAELLASESPLKRVTEAFVRERKIGILVLGTGSSALGGPGGIGMAYPARLEFALRQRFGNVNINVFSEVMVKRTADEMLETLPRLLADRRPTLVIWQTGTVDAMRGLNTNDFTNALEEGIGEIQRAGADALLMMPQYSPRTETLIAVAPYMDAMRIIGQQRDVPVFDRFAIMRQWNESGEFDLFGSFQGLTLAKRVHECIGRALADVVVNAAQLDAPQKIPSEDKASNGTSEKAKP